MIAGASSTRLERGVVRGPRGACKGDAEDMAREQRVSRRVYRVPLRACSDTLLEDRDLLPRCVTKKIDRG